MATLTLSIEADLCGPISIGTVGVIRALMAHLGCSISEAEALVDRCVFNGESVVIELPTRTTATALVAALSLTAAAPRINTLITD